MHVGEQQKKEVENQKESKLYFEYEDYFNTHDGRFDCLGKQVMTKSV